jgi:two-component system, LytTR family, response regulator
MAITCVAVDEDALALELIKAHIARIPALTLLQIFDDAIATLDYLRTTLIDILFIDTQVHDISGIDLVRSLEKKPAVIFTTTDLSLSDEGLQSGAIAYLLKPVEFDQFANAVSKALDCLQLLNKSRPEQEESLFVNSRYRLMKINLGDIEYIESQEDYLKIHITGSEPVLTLMTLKKVLQKLPAGKFKRIHRSYVVATARVSAIQNRKAILASGQELPISTTYLSFIQDWKHGAE